ncbi:MAG TPA: hypothetical protein H9881_16490 [Candidatus Stackebrandtia excrementipullorum]|nr:hypothetical protein [Candidatus Stackebrandtia excrementipullorum]
MDIGDLITYDDRQRMVPSDIEEMRAAVDGNARGDTYRQLRSAGVGCITLGEYDRAFHLFERARELADSDGRHLVLDMNIADAHRYSGDPSKSERMLRDALNRARRSHPEMVSFALQHLGKCLIDRQRLDEAREVLTEALDLRIDDGDASLIASTRAALALAQR